MVAGVSVFYTARLIIAIVSLENAMEIYALLPNYLIFINL
jgi:hypothetical protein